MSLERIIQILGGPAFSAREDAGWDEKSQRTGVIFPEDFRAFVDAYGPGQVNLVGFLHPASGRSTLYEEVLDTVDFLGPLFERGDLPAPLGWLEGQLLPFAHEVSGVELAFWVTAAPANDWHVCAFAGGEFRDFECGFEEWLHRYLVGDELVGRWLGGSGEQPARFRPAG